MGIPKFFRYISERYPLTSQLIQENKIPEFDNLYLDFNGIIHNCSHPNDEDAHFRLSEEQIFTSIFTYVDHLFGKIRPKKLLFMAVDGVAPRAKMNQQRSRRFRTAREAKEIREKAIRRGEELPQEKAFDSNCITPGTPFMARLSNQLRYFINKKITEDAAWREVQVIISGHEVPGEGEHKIMEYIRHSKAQLDYDPNVRHCLYGLDADLIMLGLLSHDPHFCLLREEVKFGSARKKGSTTLEQQNFFLLHLSLLREYLDLEFRDIAPSLSFPYNLERVIDDFVLFAVFVGNDFLPNLPDLHIHENGLEKLFNIYKRVLPELDGYLNESGIINNKRLQVILRELAVTEEEAFERENMDMNWFKGKQTQHVAQAEEFVTQGSAGITKSQENIFQQVQGFVLSNRGASRDVTRSARLSMLNTFSARDRAFIFKLTNELHLALRWDEYDEDDQNIITFSFPFSVNESGENDDNSSDNGDDENDDDEGNVAVDRVLNKYSRLKITDTDEVDSDERYERKLVEKMDTWKREYYQKLNIDYDNTEQMHRLIHKYAEGLQWVMLYYYSGVASWGWFYDYHYAPRISDLKGVGDMEFEFTLGSPFRPFEQLMGVLPEASKEHIPAAFRDLMYDPTSPILDFYPTEFEQDLNGKKQDWEAVVKIPFIAEKRLLDAMAPREHLLTAEEKQRNTWGTSTKFKYDPKRMTTYPSSLPGFFPDIHRCQCVEEVVDLPTLDGLHLVEGLCDGVFLGPYALAGFPSLKTVPHHSEVAYHNVNVFQAESRNKSIVVHVQNRFEDKKTEDIAREMVGKRVFIGWPFLQEGLAVAVSDSMFRHEKEKFGPHGERIFAKPHNQDWSWRRKVEKIEHTYSKRFAVAIGSTDVLVHVRPLKGLMRLDSGALVKEYEDEDKETEQVAQLAITHVESEDPRFLEKDAPSLKEEFPEGSKIFFLGEHAYGVAARVSETTESTLTVILAFFPSEQTENENFTSVVKDRKLTEYVPSYRLVDALGISPLALSRITSTFMVIGTDGQKINLGLNLKFEAKSLKVLGFTQKSANGRSWEYSEKAVHLIRQYKEAFPSIFTRLDSQSHDMIRASDLFPKDTDGQMKAIRAWLNANGVRDMEAVSLFCDNLEKDTVMQIEKLADGFNSNKSASSIKKAIVKGIPRQAVLKPEHAVYRLQNQRFGLGDRVIMVQDSGGVPLCAKGVVIGLNASSMDVVWDVPFLSGTELGGRCSQYRGSTCMFNTCLNLTHPQYIVSTRQDRKATLPPNTSLTSYTVIKPHAGTIPASGFRPSPNSTVRIMANPHRGRGIPSSHAQGSYKAALNGADRGRGTSQPAETHEHTLRDDRFSGSQLQPRSTSTNDMASSPVIHNSSQMRGGFRQNGNRDESLLPGRDPSFGSPGRGSFHSNGRGARPSTFSGGRGFSSRGSRGGIGSLNRGGPMVYRGPNRGGSTPAS